MNQNLNAVLRPKNVKKCQKCDSPAEFISRMDGELEYALCTKHYKKRYESLPYNPNNKK